jgi:hypothetical protein
VLLDSIKTIEAREVAAGQNAQIESVKARLSGVVLPTAVKRILFGLHRMPAAGA